MTRDESKLYDVRILERNLRRGTLSRKDYEKYLKGLPDRASNASWTRVWEEPPEPADRLGLTEPETGAADAGAADDDDEDELASSGSASE